MSNQNVREIQLGGKQLVFLFMASVVLAVAIFLLGISVGRGAGAPDTPEPTVGTEVALAEEPAPAEMPPATATTAGDLSYHDQLQGQSTPPPRELPSDQPADGTPPQAPALAPVAKGAGQEAAAAPPTPPAAKPAPAAAAEKPAAPANAAAADGWFVQVAAFKSRANANRQAAQLRSKGYSVVVLSESDGLFRVRVGPYTAREEADRIARQLKGSVQR